MKFAKRKAADSAVRGRIEGTLDFAVLYDSGTEKLKERREKEYRCESNVQRTERPYTATDSIRLSECIRALKASDCPAPSSRTSIRSCSKTRYWRSSRHVASWKGSSRRGRCSRGRPLRNLRDELHHFPFRDNGNGQWTTPLSELIELYDFVHEEREEPGESGHAHG